MAARPNIFAYEDFRKYLRDLYGFEKKNRKAFSFRFFAREAGFAAPNFLKLVTDGERNLTHESIQKFVKGFRLNKQEAEFFESLVFFNQAESSEEKTRFYQQMTRSRKYREIKQLEKEQFEYYSHWYYAAIREMVSMKGFVENQRWIAEHLVPAITPKQAENALDLLVKLKLLEHGPHGKLRQVDRLVSSGAEVKSLAVKNFHREMLGVATGALDRFTKDERDVSGVMVTVPSARVAELKLRVSEFRKELLSLMESGGQKGDTLYQLNIQLFPLTKKDES